MIRLIPIIALLIALVSSAMAVGGPASVSDGAEPSHLSAPTVKD